MIRTLSRLLVVAVIFVAGAVTSVNARQIPPLEGLEALRKGFAGIADFSADITQEKILELAFSHVKGELITDETA